MIAVFDVQISHIAFPEAFPALFRHPFAFGIVQDIQAAVLLGLEVVHKNLWDADHSDASGGFGVFGFFVGKVIAFADGDRRVGQIDVSPRQGSGFAAAQGKRTAAAITRAFAKEGYAISRETAQKILLLYQNTAQIPTGYFEAKPQRAVDFAEVRAAIVPDNTSASMLDTLKEKGITVYEYPAGNDTKRTELLNKVPDVRFQRAEQADREAKKNTQRQASRVIADNAAAIETLRQMMGLTRGVRISEDSILGKAEMLVKASGAKGKADTEHINEKLTFLPVTVEQLQLLKAITAGTLHVIRTENKTVSLAKTEAAVFSSMSCS